MRRTFRRRRREGKTDYKARLALLKSGRNRLVIRKTNRYIIVQIIESITAQDKTIFSCSSRDLLEKGWLPELKCSLKSLPAAYLTGLMIGKKVAAPKEVLVDIGMNRNIQKSRLYAVVKGAIDAGLKISHNTKILPSMEMLNKHKIGRMIEQLKNKI